MQRPFTVEFKNISYEVFHPEIVELNITEKNNTFDGYFNILKDISQLYIDFELLHDSGGGHYDMVYVNKTVDVCKFLNNRKLNVFFDIIYRIISDYCELPKSCPLARVKENLFTF